MRKIIACEILEAGSIEDREVTTCTYGLFSGRQKDEIKESTAAKIKEIGLNSKISKSIRDGFEPYGPPQLITKVSTSQNGVLQTGESKYTFFSWIIQMVKYEDSL